MRDGRIESCLPWEVRLSGPEMHSPVVWVSGDTTLTRVSEINRAFRPFIATAAWGLLGTIRKAPMFCAVLFPMGNSWLSMSRLCASLKKRRPPGAIFLLGGDNTNALSWVETGFPEMGDIPQLFRAIYTRLGRRGMQVRGLHDRKYRNEAGDMCTRAALSEITDWAKKNGFERVEPAGAIGLFYNGNPTGEGTVRSDSTANPTGGKMAYAKKCRRLGPVRFRAV